MHSLSWLPSINALYVCKCVHVYIRICMNTLSSGNGHTDLNSNLLIFTIDLIFFQRKGKLHYLVMLEYFSIFLAGIFVTFSGQRSGFHQIVKGVHEHSRVRSTFQRILV